MIDFLAAPSPRWFTIAAHRPFLEDLADGVWRTLSPLDEDAVSRAVVLLPTRRAARSLAEAFLAVAGAKAVLLPQIRALGDLDEGEPPFEPGDLALDLPPAISPGRRRFELAGLAVANEHLIERKLDAGAALEMADALAGFLDSCQIEEVDDPGAVKALVEGDLAQHWRRSADFLSLALDAWPRRLAELGLMDQAARRVALTRRLEARWRDHPTNDVLIAAGSTGSAPAAADLLAAIAAAPRGCAVLPGLDKSLAEKAWDQVDDQHPQGSLRRLLARAGLRRDQVRDWTSGRGAATDGRWRRRLINEALRPPEMTADWLDVIADLRREGAATGVDSIAEGLKGLSVITARTEEHQATAAALLLREALEIPGRTAALITPDAALARRVSARLARWNIAADSSAGQPLADTPVAVLASLIARAIRDPADPVTLLAILKHPLTRLGLEADDLSRAVAALERFGLRGPRTDGWAGLNRRLQANLVKARDAEKPNATQIAALGHAIELVPLAREALAPAEAPYTGDTATPAEAARGLATALETITSTSPPGVGGPWDGQAGERLAAVLVEIIDESDSLPEITRAGFSDLLDGLTARDLVRSGGASHPRLRILGVLEARLVRADLLVLAGLEEGMWPRPAPVDPFLSRPMRASLGLPAPERRIGLSAHDFAQAACAPDVVLMHSERRDGSPAVASRWLWRLRILAKGAGLNQLPGRADILNWARALDAPLVNPPDALKTAPRPRPAPPLAARPRTLAVTAVERWVRDPYGLYARSILRLYPLDRPDEPVEARARGIAIHGAFERFARDHPDALPPGAEALFEAMLLEELASAGMPVERMAREQALAANVAPWVMDFERRRRPGARLIVEQQGALTFAAPGGPFTLTAKADRIEARGAIADILDFKTGAAPTARMVRAGLAPQLTLTGAILAGGGFSDIGALSPGELLYVRVSGGRDPGSEESRGDDDAGTLADLALDGLKRRVAAFDIPSTPYVSWARPQFIGRYGGDYDHLARLWEWHVVGDAGEEAE